MLEHIRGKVLTQRPDVIIVDCGGLGLQLKVSEGARFKELVGRIVMIPVWLELQPRRVQLYGFRNCLERDRFASLVTIPGIGPATALRLLPHYETLLRGTGLPRMHGIGSGKLSRIGRWIRKRTGRKTAATHEKELRQALSSLGLSSSQVKAATARVLASAPGASLEQLIRIAVRRR